MANPVSAEKANAGKTNDRIADRIPELRRTMVNGTMHWEHFSHEADVGVRGYGRTPAEAFEQAALALQAVICDPAAVEPRLAIDIQCKETDLDYLLVAWLNALVFEMATRHMLFSQFKVNIHETEHALCLQGRAWGEPVDVVRHQPIVEVKGATLTELRVAQDAKGIWVAQCVVDV